MRVAQPFEPARDRAGSQPGRAPNRSKDPGWVLLWGQGGRLRIAPWARAVKRASCVRKIAVNRRSDVHSAQAVAHRRSLSPRKSPVLAVVSPDVPTALHIDAKPEAAHVRVVDLHAHLRRRLRTGRQRADPAEVRCTLVVDERVLELAETFTRAAPGRRISRTKARAPCGGIQPGPSMRTRADTTEMHTRSRPMDARVSASKGRPSERRPPPL
jgi:hypothetical protein